MHCRSGAGATGANATIASACGKARDFFFDVEFLFLETGNFKIINARTALGRFNGAGEGFVLLLEFLKVGRQAHGYPP